MIRSLKMGLLALVLITAASILVYKVGPVSPKTTSSITPTTVQGADVPCDVTEPNGQVPPGEGNHGNDALSTGLYPDGTVIFDPGGPGTVFEDGALGMKFWWWRHVPGQLTFEGRRLDAEAPPLRADVPSRYYGNIGFTPAGLIFPTPGCWEVTGRVGEGSLTFVTRVVKIGEGPTRG